MRTETLSADAQYFGLGYIHFSPVGKTYMPGLGEGPHQYQISAEEWWHQIVWQRGPGLAFTRRDLALTAADKDGGTHVDAEVPAAYSYLIEHGFDMILGEGNAPPQAIHLVGLRQLGWEILNSPELLALTSGAT